MATSETTPSHAMLIYIPRLVISDREIGTKQQIADGVDKRLRQWTSFHVVVVVFGNLSPRRTVATSGDRRPEESPPFGVFEDVRQDARQNTNAIHHNLRYEEEVEEDETAKKSEGTFYERNNIIMGGS